MGVCGRNALTMPQSLYSTKAWKDAGEVRRASSMVQDLRAHLHQDARSKSIIIPVELEGLRKSRNSGKCKRHPQKTISGSPEQSNSVAVW